MLQIKLSASMQEQLTGHQDHSCIPELVRSIGDLLRLGGRREVRLPFDSSDMSRAQRSHQITAKCANKLQSLASAQRGLLEMVTSSLGTYKARLFSLRSSHVKKTDVCGSQCLLALLGIASSAPRDYVHVGMAWFHGSSWSGQAWPSPPVSAELGYTQR
jgi:hypothetical protein